MLTLIDHTGQPYDSDRPGTVGGQRRTRIYGRLDCPAAARALARGGYVSQRVFFLDTDVAVAAGYRPCAVCLPEPYRVWMDRRRNDGRSNGNESRATPR